MRAVVWDSGASRISRYREERKGVWEDSREVLDILHVVIDRGVVFGGTLVLLPREGETIHCSPLVAEMLAGSSNGAQLGRPFALFIGHGTPPGTHKAPSPR